MNKIKDWILTHKKTSIAIGIVTVLLISIGSIVLTFNARQVMDSRKQIETAEAKQKEESLAKKVEEAKKILEEKVENLDKLSTEDKNKLEAVKKQLSEAIEKKDEQNIVKFQNELKTALNTAKTSIDKVIAEEKAKVEEEKKKQEEQKVEETKPTENTTANHSTSQAPASNQTEQQARPQVEASKPAEESKPAPAPAPQPEAPKPIKYCEYSGNRKPVQNICVSGVPYESVYAGRDPNSYIVKRWVNRVLSGEIENQVFHGETDRYHLIETDYLRRGLERTPGSVCFIGGTCQGFSASEGQ